VCSVNPCARDVVRDPDVVGETGIDEALWISGP
jgi:hypothetical protein